MTDMNKSCHVMLCLAALMLCTFSLGCAAEQRLVFSSTIDFLDYAFVHGDPKAGYYKLEDYEAAIRQMAEGGIKKIYLRVNVCGTTHYPSEVSAQYGDNDAYHWGNPTEAMYVINTFKKYNPCLETIRLGHKYGMEVWAWESLYDDAGLQYSEAGTENCRKTFEWLDGWALMDPWYIDNMDALAMRDPLKLPDQKEAARIDAAAMRLPVARIVFTNDKLWAGRPAPRIKSKQDLKVLVSDDNRAWRPYEGDYAVAASVTADGLNRFEVTGLNISQKYVKLAVTGMPQDNNFSFVMTHSVGQCQVYNTAGEEIASTWGIVGGDGDIGQQHRGCLSFAFGGPDRSASSALDWASRAVGFCVGVPELSGRDKYYYGVAEFTVPKAMEHKVARFVELARYPFDGFMFNTRCHSVSYNGAEYGYNPEVLAKFAARYGYAYAGTPEDIQGVFQIRADSIAEFFRRCKAESDGRPIYCSAPMPLELKDDPDYNAAFGPMPWPYRQCFADGSLDGVMMIGKPFHNGRDFSEYFTPEITGGKDVKIGLFREMGGAMPKGYQLEADVQRAIEHGLAEIELYESVEITDGKGASMVYPVIKKYSE